MQVQKAMTLFDYLGNGANADAAFDKAIAIQKNQMGQELRLLQKDIAQVDVDSTLERLQSGEGSLSLQTLDNMRNFNLIQVNKDLQQVAADLGISAELEINYTDGQWQLAGEPQDDAALKQLQAYLQRNKPLQTKLDTINKLSEMYELGMTQQYAKQLKNADVSDEQIVSYLSDSRAYLFALDSFTLSARNGLHIQSQGQSAELFSERKALLGISDAAQN